MVAIPDAEILAVSLFAVWFQFICQMTSTSTVQEGRELGGIELVHGIESCKSVVTRRHFLFTCSDTFALGYII